MLHKYHHGKNKGLKQGRKGPHFGLEIEFMPATDAKFKTDIHRFAAYLERVLLETGFPQRLFMLEMDGSLHDSDQSTLGLRLGVELIFQPMSGKLIRGLPWKAFFERLNREGLLELGHYSAGMHIHVDSDPRDYRYRYKLLWHDLLEMPESKREYLFGRTSNEYCCGVDTRLEVEMEVDEYDYTDENDEAVYYTDIQIVGYDLQRSVIQSQTFKACGMSAFMFEARYVPLNVTNFKTMELRVFASPSTGSQVLAAVDFAAKVIHAGFENSLNLSGNYSAEEFYQSLMSTTQLGMKGWGNV